MDPEEIEQIAVQSFTDHFERPEIMRDLCTAGSVVHFPWGEDMGIEEAISMLSNASLRPRVQVDDSFAAGDRVALRFRAFFPHASGGEVTRNENVILRFEGDRIGECWVAYDRLYEREQRERLADR